MFGITSIVTFGGNEMKALLKLITYALVATVMALTALGDPNEVPARAPTEMVYAP